MSNKEPFLYENFEYLMENEQKQEIEKVYEKYTLSTVCENLGLFLSQHDKPKNEDLDNLEGNIDLILEMFESSNDLSDHSYPLEKFYMTDNFISKYSQIS